MNVVYNILNRNRQNKKTSISFSFRKGVRQATISWCTFPIIKQGWQHSLHQNSIKYMVWQTNINRYRAEEKKLIKDLKYKYLKF